MKSASSVVEGSGAGIERSIITDEETNLRFIVFKWFSKIDLNCFFNDNKNNRLFRSDEEIGLLLKTYRIIINNLWTYFVTVKIIVAVKIKIKCEPSRWRFVLRLSWGYRFLHYLGV